MCPPLAWTHARSLPCHWSVASSKIDCLWMHQTSMSCLSIHAHYGFFSRRHDTAWQNMLTVLSMRAKTTLSVSSKISVIDGSSLSENARRLHRLRNTLHSSAELSVVVWCSRSDCVFVVCRRISWAVFAEWLPINDSFFLLTLTDPHLTGGVIHSNSTAVFVVPRRTSSSLTVY